MFYLTMHSTHFYLRLYDIEKGNPLPPHRLLFLINSKGSFICTIPDRIAHTTAFVTPVVEHWLEQEIAQFEHNIGTKYSSTVDHPLMMQWVIRSILHNGEREMFYLTTHSTHFIYGYMASDMVKDHSDSEKGNPLSPHRLLLSINSKGSFICAIPQTG